VTPEQEERVSVTMPQLGETVAEGTVLRWLKQIGDEVAAEEPLLEIATDKVDTEVLSPAGGVLLEIVVGPDETVGVGTVLGQLASRGSSAASRGPSSGADRGESAPPGSEP
jgi:2-oxoglutarate dehydrogenase E2 component (dihydrolipoamide succinyltransferase)